MLLLYLKLYWKQLMRLSFDLSAEASTWCLRDSVSSWLIRKTYRHFSMCCLRTTAPVSSFQTCWTDNDFFLATYAHWYLQSTVLDSSKLPGQEPEESEKWLSITKGIGKQDKQELPQCSVDKDISTPEIYIFDLSKETWAGSDNKVLFGENLSKNRIQESMKHLKTGRLEIESFQNLMGDKYILLFSF